MRKLPTKLKQKLTQELTHLCLCWQITLKDGRRLGLTDHDNDLEFASLTYHANSGIRASSLEARLGLATQGMEVQGIIGFPGLGASDIERGHLDDAEMTIWLVDWQDTDNRTALLSGGFGQIRKEQDSYTIQLRPGGAPLNQIIGRVYRRLCDADLGDKRCGVNLAQSNWRATTIIRKVTPSALHCDPITANEGWFENGRLIASNNIEGRIRSDTKTKSHRVIELRHTLTVAPAIGDSVTLIAGCDKRSDTCRAKFNNLANFQGFPEMPTEERALIVHRPAN